MCKILIQHQHEMINEKEKQTQSVMGNDDNVTYICA